MEGRIKVLSKKMFPGLVTAPPQGELDLEIFRRGWWCREGVLILLERVFRI